MKNGQCYCSKYKIGCKLYRIFQKNTVRKINFVSEAVTLDKAK